MRQHAWAQQDSQSCQLLDPSAAGYIAPPYPSDHLQNCRVACTNGRARAARSNYARPSPESLRYSRHALAAGEPRQEGAGWLRSRASRRRRATRLWPSTPVTTVPCQPPTAAQLVAVVTFPLPSLPSLPVLPQHVHRTWPAGEHNRWPRPPSPRSADYCPISHPVVGHAANACWTSLHTRCSRSSHRRNQPRLREPLPRQGFSTVQRSD